MNNPILIKRSEIAIAKYSKSSTIAYKIFNYLLKHYQENFDNNKLSFFMPAYELIQNNVVSTNTEEMLKEWCEELGQLTVTVDYSKCNHKYYEDDKIQKLVLYDSGVIFSRIKTIKIVNKLDHSEKLGIEFVINQGFLDILNDAGLRFIKLDLEKMFKMTAGAIRLYEILFASAKSQSGKKEYIEVIIGIEDLKSLLNCNKTPIYSNNNRFLDKFLSPKSMEIVKTMDWQTDVTIFAQDKLHHLTKQVIQTPFTVVKNGKNIIGVKFVISDIKYISTNKVKAKPKFSLENQEKIKRTRAGNQLKSSANLLINSDISKEDIISTLTSHLQKTPLIKKQTNIARHC